MGQNVASKDSLQKEAAILQGSCKSFFFILNMEK